jgi:hypothetical protein
MADVLAANFLGIPTFLIDAQGAFGFAVYFLDFVLHLPQEGKEVRDRLLNIVVEVDPSYKSPFMEVIDCQAHTRQG